MRVDPNEKFAGYFWIPEANENLIPGTLTISNGGGFSLEVIGSFDLEIPENLFENVSMTLPRIYGVVERKGEVTLDGCRYESKAIAVFGGIHKSVISGKLLICGAHFGPEKKVEFDAVSFSVDGLEEWTSTSGFRIFPNFGDKSYKISFDPPEERSYPIGDQFQIEFGYQWSFPMMADSDEIRLSQRSTISLKADSRTPFEEFRSIIFKVTTFLSFCLDRTLSLRWVRASSGDFVRRYPDGKEFPIDFEVFFESLPFEEEPPSIGRQDILATLPDIEASFASMFEAWLSAYDQFGPAMHLYFASRTGAHRFVDARFLSMAHCLEMFHRRISTELQMDQSEYDAKVADLLSRCDKEWRESLRNRLLHGNELSLRTRLRRLVEEVGENFFSADAAKQLVNQIVDSRNYLTHYSKDLEFRAASGTNLWSLCMKMEAIFQLHLLKILGLPSDRINALVENNRGLQRKLRGN